MAKHEWNTFLHMLIEKIIFSALEIEDGIYFELVNFNYYKFSQKGIFFV